jgi:hypothetical protein
MVHGLHLPDNYGYGQTQTHTQNMQYLLVFHDANAHNCYVISTKSTLTLFWYLDSLIIIIILLDRLQNKCTKCKGVKITPILDKLLEYKRSWIQHVNRKPRNRLPRVMKYYSPPGRRIMVDIWRDFWIRETGTGQQVAQLHERYDDDDDDDDSSINRFLILQTTIEKSSLYTG